MNQNKMPVIEGIRVDIESLVGISHQFDPDHCGKTGCCCSHYEVSLDKGEMQRLVDWQPLAAKYQPTLVDPDLDFPFEEDDTGQWVIEADENGTCPFAYRNKAGETLCSIHSAALEQGKNPYHIKPKSCTLWPLALSEDTPPILSVPEGILNFPCNKKKTSKNLSSGIDELLENAFGKQFRDAVKSTLNDKS